jgi:hypothetical protein
MPIIFGDKGKIASIISAKSGKAMKPEVETDDDMQILQALAKDAIDAVHSGSASDLARAMKAFFYHCDAMPHEEGEHE